jgi:hypothetical protein
MLKPLIYILIIVTLIAIALNSNFFQDENPVLQNQERTEEIIKEKNPHEEKKIVFKTDNKTITTPVKENNLTTQLEQLLTDASTFFKKNEDEKALTIYNKIIELTKDSNEPKILEYFANAYFSKAFLHAIYPHNDRDAAIEDYAVVINKFSSSNDKKLLTLYMRAKIEQSQLFGQEEQFAVYDELIEKFKKDKEGRFDKEIEELQLNKSFYLTQKGDESALDILDELMAKYQNSGQTKLPETIQSSILNSIELAITTGDDEEKYIDLANQYMENSPDAKPLIDMLEIIKEAQDLNPTEAFENWKKNYKDYDFPDWSFDELKNWVAKMDDSERKERITKYIKGFEELKQSRYKDPYATQTPTKNDEGQNSQDSSEPEITSEIEESETIYSYPEEDPYINDVPANEIYYPTYPSEEQLYDNPYPSTTDKNDGVSYTYTPSTSDDQ